MPLTEERDARIVLHCKWALRRYANALNEALHRVLDFRKKNFWRLPQKFRSKATLVDIVTNVKPRNMFCGKL